jgi:hypothetical protein
MDHFSRLLAGRVSPDIELDDPFNEFPFYNHYKRPPSHLMPPEVLYEESATYLNGGLHWSTMDEDARRPWIDLANGTSV